MFVLLNVLIAVAGLGIFTAISIRYRRSRMFTAPLAIIWMTFWILQAARAMGLADRLYLLVIAIIATAVATVVAVTIPYMIEDRRKKTGQAQRPHLPPMTK
jgi:hypothetical protein